jgi:hypothetical protein
MLDHCADALFDSRTLARVLGSVLLIAGVTAPASSRGSAAEPFKIAQIYFETNASACDMGIQIKFDSEGVKSFVVKDPNDRVIYEATIRNGLRAIGGQTEGFLEGAEPVVTELLTANPDCEPDPDEGTTTLSAIRSDFPPGLYDFQGVMPDGTPLHSRPRLTYKVPDGPELGAPDGQTGIDPTKDLTIHWQPVNETIPGLLSGGRQDPVDVVRYEVIVEDANGGETPPVFDVMVEGDQTSITVGRQFLEPSKEYNFEVLAIEANHNQTISEGSFSTSS